MNNNVSTVASVVPVCYMSSVGDKSTVFVHRMSPAQTAAEYHVHSIIPVSVRDPIVIFSCVHARLCRRICKNMAESGGPVMSEPFVRISLPCSSIPQTATLPNVKAGNISA